MFKNYYLLKLLIFIFFSSNVFASEKILGPGDDKTGYDSENYTTKSSSIKQRIGKKYDISEFAYIKQLGLPKLKLNQERNVFLKKAELGKKLFFDRRLSINNTFSCAMCHIPEQGFTNNELQTAVGIEGRSNLRNSPTLLNVVYNKFLFHDGREFSLQNQIWQPLLAHSEMAMPSIGFIIKKLKLIDGYIEIFEDAYPRKGISVETISDAIASYEMDTLIDDILSYSKVGQTQLSKQVLSMKQIVENALDSQNAESNYPKTTIKVAEKLPKIVGDRRMLSQLVNNLISNALKYSGKKEQPLVEIGFKNENDQTVYFIKDNGVGFDPLHKDKIFEVFSRVATEDFKGSGIGLSIAKKVVDKHKGEIWVETTPGEGSTFYFSLPDMEE